jgi:putative salt-induced outer membrane protein YdiY
LLTGLTVLSVAGLDILWPSLVSAEDKAPVEPPASEGASAEELAPEQPPQEATNVTDEGVPTVAVESSEGVREVEKAMEQVEEETKRGLPAEFTINFGDVYDWLQLNSGEWLKGNLKRMREDELEFDSDKLDLLKFSWDDVDRLQSPHVNTYVFDDNVDVVGRAVVTKDKVLIQTVDGVQSFPRSELLSIVEGGPRELNWWSTRLGLGFSANAGNTNQGSLAMYFQLTRADYRTRSRVRYDGTIGYANGEENVNRHIGTAEVLLYISRRWYFAPAAAQLLNDRFQNIHFRATPGAAAGVHVFDTKKVEWDLESGLGYQYIQFLSAAAGVENPQNDGFVSFGTWAEFEFVDDVKLEIEWRTNVVYTTIGNTNHTGRAKFSVEITDIFDFETSFLFLRTEDPPPREDGTTPESNDYQLIVSVALELD